MTTGARVPSAMRCLGWCCAPVTWFLALRLGWEATVLTARQGPQMIGFSFMHNSPLALPVILSAFLAQIWVVFVIGVAYTLWQKRAVDTRAWIQLSIVAMPVGILFLIPAIT